MVDECTGIEVSQKLKQMGLDAVSVIECMKGAEDEEIMQKSLAETLKERGFA